VDNNIVELSSSFDNEWVVLFLEIVENFEMYVRYDIPVFVSPKDVKDIFDVCLSSTLPRFSLE
jgi:hypothetical protein